MESREFASWGLPAIPSASTWLEWMQKSFDLNAGGVEPDQDGRDRSRMGEAPAGLT